MSECICRTCRKRFDDSELTTAPYDEYVVASTKGDYVSPCCHGDWDYTDAEE